MHGSSLAEGRARARARPRGLRLPAWASVELAGTAALTAAFLAVSWWWLKQDTRVPDFDNAKHLIFSLQYYEDFRAHGLLSPFRGYTQYPPLVHTVGALGVFLGGVGVRGPIMVENLVFVPLLALGCYGAGTVAAGGERLAGFLAAVFALGTPMLVSQFHVMMLDAPEAAMIAISAWLLLASDRFRRPWLAGGAGLAGGMALLVKQTSPFFLIGLVVVALVRGGWRNWRGLGVFMVAGAAVAAPWYLDHLNDLRSLATGAVTFSQGSAGGIGGPTPARISLDNFTWYLSAAVNQEYILPFCLLAGGGALAALVTYVRRRRQDDLGPELLGGALASWIGVTFFVSLHDVRYLLPALVYVAVLATRWIALAPRRWRIAGATAVCAIAVVNFCAVSFGIGDKISYRAPASADSWLGHQRITLYNPDGYVVGGPWRGGDVLGLMLAAKADGKQFVALPQDAVLWFNPGGTGLFAKIAKFPGGFTFDSSEVMRRPGGFLLVNDRLGHGYTHPCSKIEDGTYVFALVPRRGGKRRGWRPYCPPGFRAT